MKKEIIKFLDVPENTVCTYENGVLKCKKGSLELERKIIAPNINIKIDGNKIILHCKKGNRKDNKTMVSFLAHIRNLFLGLDEKFVYHLESVNVHFPMSVKLSGSKVTVDNFLGEKVPRSAKILPGVDVEIKGQKITVSSNSRESAGQTAANLEKATKVSGRDRRIFQDGIFIVSKPGRQK